MSDAPRLDLQPAPCPKCGAVNKSEWPDKCRPKREAFGEVHCPGENTDNLGQILQPTAESLAAVQKYLAETRHG